MDNSVNLIIALYEQVLSGVDGMAHNPQDEHAIGQRTEVRTWPRPIITFLPLNHFHIFHFQIGPGS